MRKQIVFLLIIFLAFKLSLAQQFNISNPELNQIFLRLMSFVYKINYFDQKLNLAKLEIIFPTSKNKFKPGDDLRISWKLSFDQKLSKAEQNDYDYIFPYSWRISLYNTEISSQPLKETILPFELSGNYNYSFPTSLSFVPSNKYFFIIELRNNFSNKIIKTSRSSYFQIISLEEARIRLNDYLGYLLKLPLKSFDDLEYFLVTPVEIYFLKSEKINLNSYVNTFVRIKGKEFQARSKNFKVIEVVKLFPYR